jgi:uncharacterized protein (DUF58 family)
VNTGNNLLFLIVSSMLGFMAISGVFGLRNLQRLGAVLILPDEIYPGITAQATLQITSRSRMLSHFLLTFHLRDATVSLPFLRKAGSARMMVPVVFPLRGPGNIDHLAVSSPFPVNFFVRSIRIDTASPYLVFPRPKPLPSASANGDEAARGETAFLRKGGSGELEAISPYTGREPLKLVHWKLSARHEELFVREMQNEQGTPVTINPDELPGTLEERLSHAAFLINSLMAAGRAVGLQLGDETLSPGMTRGHRLRMLGMLARHAQN